MIEERRTMEKQMDLNKKSFIPVHTNIENVELDGEKVLRVIKVEKIMEFDENTYAKLKDFSSNSMIFSTLITLNTFSPSSSTFSIFV